MSVSYVISLTVRQGSRERFLDLLNEVLDSMRHEDNFVDSALHEDPDDPLHFLLYETWRDHQDVVDVQLKRPYRDAWHAALPEILVRPRDLAIWRPLRSDRRG